MQRIDCYAFKCAKITLFVIILITYPSFCVSEMACGGSSKSATVATCSYLLLFSAN